MFSELSDQKYTTLRRSLLREKGSPLQRELLEQTIESGGFVRFLNDLVPMDEGESLPSVPEAMTENEFKEPPSDTESAIYECYKAVSPAIACRPTFWGAVTLSNIMSHHLEATFLACNGGSLPSGRARIEYALRRGNDKEIDSCVRTILRRLSGLPEARGNRSVYVDCPIARAWWREYLCNKICETTSMDRAEVLGVLRISQQYWEEVVSLMVSRNSVLGDRRLRDVLVAQLAMIKSEAPDNEVLRSKCLRTLCRLLGIRGAWQEYSALSMEELGTLIRNEIRYRWLVA